jgi:hypothetical protein
MGLKVAEALRDKGVLGRFAVDFISVKNKNGWTHYPIEINLRKGGTTHPYIMLQFLTMVIMMQAKENTLLLQGKNVLFLFG